MASPELHVVCAVILHEDGRRIFAAQRPEGKSLAGKWEFPGGKVEPDEDEAAALKREMAEELGVIIKVGLRLPAACHSYPTFAIRLQPFLCEIESGEITLHEHAAWRWIEPAKWRDLDWAEADVPIVQNCALLELQIPQVTKSSR